jgi:hypothetical protein
MYGIEEDKKTMISQAKKELVEINALMILAQCNDFGLEISIGGLKMGLCNNKKIIPILKYQKGEIEKFIRGEANMWK